MEAKRRIKECSFNNKDLINCQELASLVINDYNKKQNELVENLIKERLKLLNVEYTCFYDFVKDNLSVSYSPKETIIIYKELPLLTYWFEMGTPNLINNEYKINSNFYYL